MLRRFWLALAVAAVGITGCAGAAWQPVSDAGAAAPAELRLTLADGRTVRLADATVGADSVRGRAAGARAAYARAEVSRIERPAPPLHRDAEFVLAAVVTVGTLLIVLRHATR